MTLWWALACACEPDPALALPVEAVTLDVVAKGLSQLTDVQRVPGQRALVVLQKDGHAIRIDESGATSAWLTVDVRTESEMGLLGLAFSPDFATSGEFVLHTNPADGEPRSQLSRWRCDPATLANPVRRSTILELAQPYPNHDGGQVRFGPDGMLYVGFGDGGSAGDPLNAGQDLSTWLGSIVRVDLKATPYAVPTDNPFVGRPGAKPEIWAYGLRNPWRFDFLPDGRLIIGDVGQNKVEEITVGGAGANHGWKIREGDRCYEPARDCPSAGLTEPVFTYTHAVGQSVTGGVIARNGRFAGRYVFGDFASGELFVWDPTNGAAKRLGKQPVNPAAFGLDADGQVLMADFGGTLYRLR